LLATAATASAETVQRGRFRTQFTGANMCLDTVNGGSDNNQAQFTPCGNFSGQIWTVTVFDDNSFTMTNDFRGPGMCMDVVNGGPRNNQLELRPCGNFSGQRWRAVHSPGFFKLKNDFRGSGFCADVVNGGPRNNKVELRPCGNFSGQNWTFFFE
jgi:hypothetical protein